MTRAVIRIAAVALSFVMITCSSTQHTATGPAHHGGGGGGGGGGTAVVGTSQTGYATWYGGGHDGGPTASGERFNKRALTAAHRTLKMGTRVRVTNKRNGKSVIVRINDRGPFGSATRIIDVSEKAAELLDMIDAGVVPVTVEVLP